MGDNTSPSFTCAYVTHADVRFFTEWTIVISCISSWIRSLSWDSVIFSNLTNRSYFPCLMNLLDCFECSKFFNYKYLFSWFTDDKWKCRTGCIIKIFCFYFLCHDYSSLHYTFIAINWAPVGIYGIKWVWCILFWSCFLKCHYHVYKGWIK